MKKLFYLLLVAFTITLLSGCANLNKSNKLTIYTTLFPQYDFAKQIGKDKVNVKLLLKPGVESHSYEPSPQDIMNVDQADLFIYTNPVMEPWVEEKLLASLENEDLRILDVSKNIPLLDLEHENGQEEEDDHGTGHEDPHVWTSLRNALLMIDTILNELIKIDPDNKTFYRDNAEAYKEKIAQLDKDFKTLFSNSTNKTIIHGGHFSLGYFANDYGLTYVSPYKGFTPDQQLTYENITAIINVVEETGLHVIYYEELLNVRSAETIKNELKARGTNVELKLLHGVHNVSNEELKNKATYVSLMRQNYENLQVGFKQNG